MRYRRALAVLALTAQFVVAGGAGITADAVKDKERVLAQLRAAIVKKMSFDCGVAPRKRAVFEVGLLESGYVSSVKLVESSGSSAYDAALMAAVASAQPYKLPANAESRKDLLQLNLKFYTDGRQVPPCK